MNPNRHSLFIALSLLTMCLVLAIQVNWILQNAKMKEQLFNDKANMVLSRTAEALKSDSETYQKIEACAIKAANAGLPANLGKDEARKIDSTLKHFMHYYNFQINYAFTVIKPSFNPLNSVVERNYIFAEQHGNFRKCLDDVATENSLEIKLLLPEKNQFILAELGPMFITSVVLILMVMVLFWRTVLSLMKERELSEHTTDFLNNMTHEFKTPMTNISLAGKMLLKDENITQEDKVIYYSGIIIEENEKLRLQVEQVLRMTALERGEIPIQKMELDFHQLLQKCLIRMKLQLENKHVKVELNLNARQFVITGDKTHLTNAICNLIDNALKYSINEPELRIETKNIGQNIVLTFADNGIGIARAYQQKVFEKFFRVPTGDVHNVKGFGLGLAYIKKIAELHNGSIDLQSELGCGTTFTLTLPYA